MKIRRRRYIPGDLYSVPMRDLEKLSGVKKWDAMCSELTACWTFEWGGLILGVGGFVPIDPANAEVFLIPTLYVELHKVAFHREVLRTLDRWQTHLGYSRIQTHSHDDPNTNKWMEALGFRCEGVHPRYCHGLTYRTWARLT